MTNMNCMANRQIQNKLDWMLRWIPNHFGGTYFHLLDYKLQKGTVEVTVNGCFESHYFFDVDIKIIKSIFKWLEGILSSPHTEGHEFQIFEKDDKRFMTLGYIPFKNNGSYHESTVSPKFPEIPLTECGMYYVYDNEKDKVLESAFFRYEDLVRRIYTSIKSCKRLRASSHFIESYFLNKDDIIYEYKGIVCKGSVSKGDLRYYGSFFDGEGELIDGFGIAADYESSFKNRAESTISRILEHKEFSRNNDEWHRNIDAESIGCVFDILPEAFRQRIIEGKYDTSLNEKVIGGDYEVPLPYVTKAWDKLLKDNLGINEFRIEYDPEWDIPVDRTKEQAIEQNEQMKTIWKEFFNIDIDAIEIDFSKFNMHLLPNVSTDVVRDYFQDIPDGIEEWILLGINTPTGVCSFDAVSSLMEFVAYTDYYKEEWAEEFES